MERVSLSVGGDIKAMTGAIAGEAAIKNPAEVKNMEKAVNRRTRRTLEMG